MDLCYDGQLSRCHDAVLQPKSLISVVLHYLHDRYFFLPDESCPCFGRQCVSTVAVSSWILLCVEWLLSSPDSSHATKLPLVYSYTEDIEARKHSRKALSKELLTRAFEVMDRNKSGRIGRESIMALFLILSEDYPEIRSLSEEEKLIVFGFLDKDGTSTITYDEFLEFGDVLLLEFTKQTDYATFVEVKFPKIYHTKWYQGFCSVIRSSAFEYGIDCILLLNAVIIAIQSYPQLSGQKVAIDSHYSDGNIDTVWELMETIFTGVYVVEAALKILVDGWKKYSESARNVFDFTITALAILATAYVYCESIDRSDSFTNIPFPNSPTPSFVLFLSFPTRSKRIQ